MKCPHCGGETSGYRLAILDLADGSKTINEIAELLGKDPKVVRATVNVMQREGHEIKLKNYGDMRRQYSAKREVQVIQMILDDLSLSQISKALGVSSSRIGQIRDRALRRMKRENPTAYSKYLKWQESKSKSNKP